MKKKFYLSSAASQLLLLALVSVFLFTAITVFAPFWAKQLLEQETKVHLRTYASSVGRMLDDSDNPEGSKGMLDRFMPEDTVGLRLILTDQSGMVMYDNSSVQNKVGSAYLSSAVQTALQGKESFSFSHKDGTFYSVLSVPYKGRDGRVSAAVCMLMTDTELGRIYSRMRSSLFISATVLSVVPLLVGAYILYTQNRNMKQLVSGIRTFRDGDWNARIVLQTRTRNEYSILADDLNALCEKLADTDEMRRRFISDASHELKTPMATIKLLSDSIVQAPDISREDLTDFLQDIINEIDRLARISGRMLSLARLDDPHEDQVPREVINIAQVARTVCHMLLPLAQASNCSLRAEICEESFVFANYDEIYQVFLNLIENAIKYSGHDKEIRVLMYNRHNTCHFIVDDDGEGTPEAELKKIFDRFYRVDKARARATGGTGLGLSIVSSVVERTKGTVEASNRPGGGARFLVKLPLSEKPDEGSDGGDLL